MIFIPLICVCGILSVAFPDVLSNEVTSNYAMAKEAKEDTLFQRGWLPDIFLESTTSIEFNNDLEMNTSAGMFFIPSGNWSL